MFKSLLFSLFICLFFTQLSFTQEPCATDIILKEELKKDPNLKERIRLREEKIKQLVENPSLRSISGVIRIPIVVHVVYHDDEENVSDELIQAQIEVLNQDFRRLNTDADDTWPQAVDTEIEFALAQFDPCGFPTTGITRTYTATDISVVEGQGKAYISEADYGGKDGWPSGSYLNFWIADIPPGLRGFATYPEIGIPDNDDPTQGIYVDYLSVGGSSGNIDPNNKGRTATHEVGHWLNLIHVWGSGPSYGGNTNCFDDDLVSDTPNSDNPNYGCQIGSVSCGSVDMVQNYMDYSNDDCMNLFTEGQKQRMRATFETVNGGRQLLLSSQGLAWNYDTLNPTCPGDSNREMTFFINFDEFPQDISWDIKNENGEIVALGGPYDEGLDELLNIPSIYANLDYAETFCIPDGTYNFTIYDAFGDNVCCNIGEGYTLTDGYGTVFISNDQIQSTPFTLEPCIDSTPLEVVSASYYTICIGNSTTLNASGGMNGTDAAIVWYNETSCISEYIFPTSVNVETNSPLGTGPSIIVSPTTTTTYFVKREGLCNSTENLSITIVVIGGDGNTSACPPDNDEIVGASNLQVGSTVCETPIIATNIGATNTIENDNEASCSSFDPAGDVWFKVLVPSSGDLTIETSLADVKPIFDTVMEVYSGVSGALIEVACDDNSGSDLFSRVAITGRTPGEVLLVRVWEFGNESTGFFKICAWSPSSLGVEENTFDGFTYYPNPIKDVLTLESTRAIDKIEVFNVLGQRIISINRQNTIQYIDMANVQTGVYFIKVSIENQIKTIKVIKN